MLVRLYFWAEALALEIADMAPDILPMLAGKFRFTRVQKQLQVYVLFFLSLSVNSKEISLDLWFLYSNFSISLQTLACDVEM